MSTPVPGQVCPRCAAALCGFGEEPRWCPRCEWNLEAVSSPGSDERGRLERRLDALAFGLDTRLAEELSARVPGPPARTAARLGLIAVSVLLGGLVLALLVVGVTMVLTASLAWKALGALFVGLAVELRPRLPRLGIALGYTTRPDQPALFAILDTVCTRLGAPLVDAVVIDESFDATCKRYGVRRRRVLTLGLPLWAALSPSARVALLAHQIGHLIDHDPADGLLTQPALTTFGNLARVFDPNDVVRKHQLQPRSGYDGAIMAHTSQGFLLFEWIASLFSALVFAPLQWLFASLQHLLTAVTARSRQRAEYYADALAFDLAGAAGMVEYCETLLLAEPVSTAIRRWLRVGADVDLLQSEAAEARERNRGDLRRLEQHSMRVESSLFAEHPPAGRRLRAVRSWPDNPARLDAVELDFAAADAQLASAYRRVERALSHLP